MDDTKGWTPVLHGKIFCSPRCGCMCTVEQHERANEVGRHLVATLGDGWTYQVWENGGWHVKAVRGVLELYPTRSGMADSEDPDAHCTVYFQSEAGQIVKAGSGWTQTIHAVLAEVRMTIQIYQTDLAEVSG